MALDYSSDIAGMTTNERLYHFGLLDQFDTAVKARNRNGMIATLGSAMVDDPMQVAGTILGDPSAYGF